MHTSNIQIKHTCIHCLKLQDHYKLLLGKYGVNDNIKTESNQQNYSEVYGCMGSSLVWRFKTEALT